MKAQPSKMPNWGVVMLVLTVLSLNIHSYIALRLPRPLVRCPVSHLVSILMPIYGGSSDREILEIFQ